jgi:cell division protein ZapA
VSNQTVTVRILDKDYQVACPPEERSALIQSAELLDARMRAIKNTGSVIGLERIAVMVALNLSHELLQANSQNSTKPGADKAALRRLQDKIDRALGELDN